MKILSSPDELKFVDATFEQMFDAYLRGLVCRYRSKSDKPLKPPWTMFCRVDSKHSFPGVMKTGIAEDALTWSPYEMQVGILEEIDTEETV